MNIIKVSAHSLPKAVAGAIAAGIREADSVEVHAVGAGAINQAIKAIVIARRFIEGDIVCVPDFTEVVIGGEQRTAVSLVVERR